MEQQNGWTPVEETAANKWTPVTDTGPAKPEPSWRDKVIGYLSRPQEAPQAIATPVGQAQLYPEDPMSYMGRRALGGVAKVVLHPVDTAMGILDQAGDAFMAAAGDPASAHKILDQGKSLLKASATDLPGTAAEFMGQGSALHGAAKGVGAIVDAAKPMAAKVARNLYGSALKPSTTITPAERSAVIETGLQNRIPVSPEGLKELNDLVENLNTKIADVINTDPKRPINPNVVATRVDQLGPRLASQVNAAEDLAAADSVKQQFLAEQGARPASPAISPRPTGLLDAQGNPIMTQGSPDQPPLPAPNMPAFKAQQMKQGTYQALGGRVYGEMKSATIEAQKSLARGLKEELANQFPELSNLNSQESKLLDLQPLLEKAVSRHANKQLIGIGTPAAIGAAKAATGSNLLSGGVGFLKAALDDQMIKSRLAIALSKSGKIPYSAALARVGAYSASLARAAQSQPATQDDQEPSE